MTPKILAFAGSTRTESWNKKLVKIAAAGARAAGAEVTELDLRDIPLPLYDGDLEHEQGLPPNGRKLKDLMLRHDGFLISSPEYNSSISGVLKNAIDWASRPWGQNAFDHIPAAVIGASIGSIGTALAQQSLRAVLSFCNARQMTAPEAYLTYTPELFPGNGAVSAESTTAFLSNFMAEFRDHIVRVLTVLPRDAATTDVP